MFTGSECASRLSSLNELSIRSFSSHLSLTKQCIDLSKQTLFSVLISKDWQSDRMTVGEVERQTKTINEQLIYSGGCNCLPTYLDVCRQFVNREM